jgi:hypothetical protein
MERTWNIWCAIIVVLIDKWNPLKKKEECIVLFSIMNSSVLYYEFVYINLNSIMDSSSFNYAIIMLIWRLHAETENILEYCKTLFIFLHRILHVFFENVNIGENR